MTESSRIWISRLRQLAARLSRSAWLRPGRLFPALALLPTLIVLVYTGLIASPMYISDSMFAIKATVDSSAPIETGGHIGYVPGVSPAKGDSYLVSNYVRSWDLFSRIDEDLDLREHYQNPERDFFSRFSAEARQEDVLDYWRWLVDLAYDPNTGIIKCRVKAYDSDMAWQINRAIIEYSESLINDMNRRARQDSLDQALAELKLSEDRLMQAHAEIRAIRKRTAILSPQSESATHHLVISNLENKAAKMAAELKEAEAYMRDNSPVVVNLRRKLEALNDQLAAERGKLAGSTGSERRDWPYLSEAMERFEDLKMEEEFARQRHQAALSALENARIRHSLKSRYLVAFEPPLRPDRPLYPRVLKSSLVTFFGAALILGILSLTVAAIREHAGFY